MIPALGYALAFALGMGVTAYPSFAAQNGWGAWSQYSKNTSFIGICGFLAWTTAVLLAINTHGWLVAGGVALGGFIMAFILVSMLKKNFQYLGVFALPSLIVTWLSMAEIGSIQ